MHSLSDLALGAQNDGVGDETVLELLDAVDHGGLLLGCAVVVDDTETTVESESNGHTAEIRNAPLSFANSPVLRDSVHGGREEGSVENNVACDAG